MTVRTCTHARCVEVIDDVPCTWAPDPTSKRHVWNQAEAHSKAESHAVTTITLPADDCAVHRTKP